MKKALLTVGRVLLEYLAAVAMFCLIGVTGGLIWIAATSPTKAATDHYLLATSLGPTPAVVLIVRGYTP